MKQERLPGCAFRIILFSVFVALFIIYGLLSCSPKIYPNEQFLHVSQAGDTTVLDAGDMRILKNYIDGN